MPSSYSLRSNEDSFALGPELVTRVLLRYCNQVPTSANPGLLRTVCLLNYCQLDSKTENISGGKLGGKNTIIDHTAAYLKKLFNELENAALSFPFCRLHSLPRPPWRSGGSAESTPTTTSPCLCTGQGKFFYYFYSFYKKTFSFFCPPPSQSPNRFFYPVPWFPAEVSVVFNGVTESRCRTEQRNVARLEPCLFFSFTVKQRRWERLISKFFRSNLMRDFYLFILFYY